ncbi:hypothetical protein C489_13316 [Natrinema versiforme JCM 10478]|uniref:Uncharacterized protein n=1 Tax=Natrinema versiforme JCM 10478 TaxID=1227496 RepID=L9XWX2_9EURY|nr:hypothetical protein C489_13316 [Natrinema versiforme JCM 10478]
MLGRGTSLTHFSSSGDEWSVIVVALSARDGFVGAEQPARVEIPVAPAAMQSLRRDIPDTDGSV